jgi:pimeloyl-ACP methyl ester carboxylesterase
MSTKHVDLSAGRIKYSDTGEGPPIVFVHGLFNDGRLWSEVIPALEGSFRCIAPDWPLGSHTIPMNPDADLSPPGVARLIGELLEALDLDGVTLVANDTGGALTQILLAGNPARVGRVVLTPCDCFDNFLPPMFRPLSLLAKVPPLLTALLQPLRLRPLRRLPNAFGWLSKRPLPKDVSDGFVRPFFSRREIRRDTAKLLAGIDSRHTQEAAERLGSFDRPVLIAWAPEDRFFPLEHAKRLAGILPDARVVEIADSWTYVPVDQPERTAELIREHAGAGASAPSAAPERASA